MKISSVGRFLDQPLISSSISRKMPLLLAAGSAVFGLHNTLNAPCEERFEKGVKNAFILTFATGASILGARGLKIKGKQILPGLMENLSKKEILTKQAKSVDKFIKKNQPDDKVLVKILNNAKTKLLTLDETDYLFSGTNDYKNKKELLEVLFNAKDNLNSKEIFSEIKKLSLMGLLPVIGGIIGGIAGDKTTKTDSKEKTTNKIKEGLYQYLANIFLCNVGAGSALFAAESLQKKGIIKELSILKKTGIILAGILAVGVFGGSAIANFIGDKFINPVLDKHNHKKNHMKYHNWREPFNCVAKSPAQNPYHKKHGGRKPEALDLALHSDDIVTAGILAGIKWVEPLLPALYIVSAYKAGTGYRNDK